ncbi:hypothetical protein ATANTOWER_028738 [Ataeniobius toweri]|uniref:Uncharacterized protein n=1 Tax=Ataeniobius toweri TaxID=208326 RepID=A0ABU7C1J8_9TELE|nr:hypothetical protein [Ataeniobius toweri]
MRDWKDGSNENMGWGRKSLDTPFNMASFCKRSEFIKHFSHHTDHSIRFALEPHLPNHICKRAQVHAPIGFKCLAQGHIKMWQEGAGIEPTTLQLQDSYPTQTLPSSCDVKKLRQ